MNNCLEVAHQLSRFSIDSTGSSCTSSMDSLAYSDQEFGLDYSGFDGMMPSPSYASSSSFNSLSSSRGNGLSRSGCIHSLSALVGVSSMEDMAHSRQISFNASRPNEGWGYFVDTPAK